mmetsp:Transcript_33568/g.73983  ORF Transcript_33568/g.73983 Transcript_33568/m.73983 type:complete len:736 (+) Transcript_33568:90-2297(+)
MFKAVLVLLLSLQLGGAFSFLKPVRLSTPLCMQNKYCEDTTRPVRRPARTVTVGRTLLGSAHKVAKQTMTTTITRDVDASVAQIMKIASMGGELVRLTVQGRFEADACAKIKEQLLLKGCDVPLVADIHFAPAVATRIADVFEKIRINPGNFADGIKSFENKVYDTRAEFDADIPEIERLLVPLILKCKEKNRAMRIGTNHGSLSARVMSFWGDSPRGMVESAIEFANICRKHDYHNFVFSMKASNPLVMVQAYRLLASEMYLLGWDYPLHLGVTEAGEGEDGRMKSAIGIGSLLADGLGDTVRVSLTEDPEFELGPCQKLIDIGTQLLETPSLFERIPAWTETTRDFSVFTKRRGDLPEQMEGDEADIRGYLHRDGSVLSVVTPAELASPEKLYKGLGARMVMGMPFKDIDTADSIYLPTVPTTEDKNARRVIKRLQDVAVGVLAPLAQLLVYPFPHAVAVLSMAEYVEMNGKPPLPEMAMRFAVQVTGIEEASMYAQFKALSQGEGNMGTRVAMLILSVPEGVSRVHGSRRCFQMLSDIGSNLPVIHAMGWGAALSNGQSDLVSDSGSSGEITKDEAILRIGSEVGALLVDGLGDGVMLSDPGFGLETTRKTSFGLLQGARMRSTKTDFVSCPSCGRTLFDLQEVTEQIKQKTGHLPGVAVAIMGCIVNGPGEMADADFGYVGGAPGKVDLYVGRDVVKRGIANALACDALVELIKENGRWVDPRPVEEMASA